MTVYVHIYRYIYIFDMHYINLSTTEYRLIDLYVCMYVFIYYV